MNEAYVKGFMDKCAAASVDPEALLQKIALQPLANIEMAPGAATSHTAPIRPVPGTGTTTPPTTMPGQFDIEKFYKERFKPLKPGEKPDYGMMRGLAGIFSRIPGFRESMDEFSRYDNYNPEGDYGQQE